MRRILGNILLYIGVLAILGSAGLTAYAVWDENRAKNSAEKTQAELSVLIGKEEPEPVAEPLADIQEEAYEEAPIEEVPQLIEIDGAFYIGILSIPALSLNLPINNDLDETALKDSPCRYHGELSGALVIGAHRYKHHFGRLYTLSPGDAVVITDAKGTEHPYTVALMEELPETDIDARINSPYDLTLFTCTTTRTERVTVRCTRVNPLDNGGPEDTRPVFDIPDGAPDAPNVLINYAKETVKIKKGYLYSLDGGRSFVPVTEGSGTVLDISGHITDGTPIYVQKAATKRAPASQMQTLTPLARPILENYQLTPVKGSLTLDKAYEVYNLATKKWGRKLPKISADTVLYIRLKNTAKTVHGRVTGRPASLPGHLIITYGAYAGNKKGIIAAEIANALPADVSASPS